ncbi:CU044_5270 family protein [Longispora albida]|uniref:CU044_5270 family protein n=1 Tax=Longispora albida TaxID=203523 RepID=UPI0003714274|nr:CU044_5270 family protein [Longispora albida]
MTKNGMELLAELRSGEGDASPDTMDRMRHAVLNGTVYADARKLSFTRRRPVLAGSLATVLAAGLIAGAVAVTGGSHSPSQDNRPGAAAPAVQVTGIQLAAATVAKGTPVAVQPGQYVYRKSLGNNAFTTSGVSVRVENRYEMWFEPQGMILVWDKRTEGINPTPLTPADAGPAEAAGLLSRPPGSSTQDLRNDEWTVQERQALATQGPSLERPTPEFLAGLPVNPDELLAFLRQQRAGSSDIAVFGTVGALLHTHDEIVPPQLRGALYLVLPKLGTVTQVEGYTQVGGRTGIAFRVTPNGGKDPSDLILEPGTYRYIGSRNNPGQTKETWTVVTESKIVNGLPGQ